MAVTSFGSRSRSQSIMLSLEILFRKQLPDDTLTDYRGPPRAERISTKSHILADKEASTETAERIANVQTHLPISVAYTHRLKGDSSHKGYNNSLRMSSIIRMVGLRQFCTPGADSCGGCLAYRLCKDLCRCSPPKRPVNIARFSGEGRARGPVCHPSPRVRSCLGAEQGGPDLKGISF